MNASGSRRTALIVAHTGRKDSLRSARLVVERLIKAGLNMRVLEPEAADIACTGVEEVPAGPQAAEGAEIVIVVGGDGTILRAAELARPAGAPLLGVNLGHVGFLAEAEPDGLADTVDRIVARQFVVEERMTVDVTVQQDGAVVAQTWALNEATVEKAARERMLEVVTEVDGRPLSRWGCDGVVCATPTGSTAYAFSAGGWSGPRSRRCSWCRSAPTPCSPGRWSSHPGRCSRSRSSAVRVVGPNHPVRTSWPNRPARRRRAA